MSHPLLSHKTGLLFQKQFENVSNGFSLFSVGVFSSMSDPEQKENFREPGEICLEFFIFVHRFFHSLLVKFFTGNFSRWEQKPHSTSKTYPSIIQILD